MSSRSLPLRKKKSSPGGSVLGGAPKSDDPAASPGGVSYQYKMTADPGVLTTYLDQVRDAVLTCSQSSSDPRLYLNTSGNPCDSDSPGLMLSNNVWEDSYATFIYSNANIVRGLWDAASSFNALGLFAERDDANTRAASIKAALDARLACNTENTDISQLGVVYPFKVYGPLDSRVVPFETRITSQLVNAPGFFNDGYGWTGLVNRYVGDTYWGNGSPSSPWGAGPWFLSTAWYGMYLADRADFTPGKADINAHKSKIDLMIARLGPAGFGAEQIAPRGIPGQPAPWNTGSLLYPGQNDFVLQTAWPNAWESMSTFVDSIMAFLDYDPDAPSNTMRIAPKLPSDWGTMTFSNITLVNAPAGHTHKVSLTITEAPTTGNQTLVFTNSAGFAVNMQPTLKLPVGRSACSVRVNGTPTAYTPDISGRLTISTFPLATGANAITTLIVTTVAGNSPDFNRSGALEVADIFAFLNAWFAGDLSTDFNSSAALEVADIFGFLNAWFAGC